MKERRQTDRSEGNDGGGREREERREDLLDGEEDVEERWRWT